MPNYDGCRQPRKMLPFQTSRLFLSFCLFFVSLLSLFASFVLLFRPSSFLFTSALHSIHCSFDSFYSPPASGPFMPSFDRPCLPPDYLSSFISRGRFCVNNKPWTTFGSDRYFLAACHSTSMVSKYKYVQGHCRMKTNCPNAARPAIISTRKRASQEGYMCAMRKIEGITSCHADGWS